MSVNPVSKAISGAIRVELLRRCISRREFAECTGVKIRHLNNIIAGRRPSKGVQRKIEVALDMAFWMTRTEFSARRPLARFYGADPAFLTLRELDALAAKHLPAVELRRPIRPRAALVQRLEDFFAEQTPHQHTDAQTEPSQRRSHSGASAGVPPTRRGEPAAVTSSVHS